MTPTLVGFAYVRVNIAGKRFRQMYASHKVISSRDFDEVNAKIKEIERAMMRLEHTKSVLENIARRYVP